MLRFPWLAAEGLVEDAGEAPEGGAAGVAFTKTLRAGNGAGSVDGVDAGGREGDAGRNPVTGNIECRAKFDPASATAFPNNAANTANKV